MTLNRGRSERQHTVIAVWVGLAACMLNLATELAVPDAAFNPGTVLVMLVALTMTPRVALITAALSCMPVDILVTGFPLQSLRQLLLAWGVAFASERLTQLPGFIIAYCAWVAVVGPVMLALDTIRGVPYFWTLKYAFAACTTDTVSALIAGTIIIAPNVWYRFSDRPRVLSLGSVLAHLFTLLTMLGAFGVTSLTLTTHGSHWRMALGESIPTAAGALAIMLFLPTAIAYRLAGYIAHNSEQFDFMSIISRIRQGTFSGLSSDYWRRQNSSDSMNDDDSRREPLPVETRGIVAIQRNGTISFANRVFLNLADAKNNEVVGKNIRAIGLKPELSQALMDVVDASVSTGPRSIEKKLESVKGPRFLQLSTQLSASPDYKSLVASAQTAIVIVTDVTERRTIETSLLRAQKLDSLGAMASGVAHEFSNSLTTIAGLASIVSREKLAPEVKNTFEGIIKVTKEAGAIVRNLLDYCSSSASDTLETTKLCAAISERLPLIRQILGEECPLIVSNKELEASIRVDKHLLTQALTNVIFNAKESYGNKPGKVEIDTGVEELDQTDANLYVGAAPGRYARITVKDSGCGMTAETLEKAFQPLFTTKSGQGHSGLGLSIVYAVVRASDGFMIIESQPEKGTKVSIYLPLAANAEKEIALEPQPLAPTVVTTKGQRILVVEDDKQVRELVVLMLKELGYDVVCYEGGEAALRETSVHQIDLVLVDMIMPGMRGTELIKRLKELRGDLKTLIMTGYTPDAEQRSLASNVLNKPFDVETLAKAVKETLVGKRFSAAQFVKQSDVIN